MSEKFGPHLGTLLIDRHIKFDQTKSPGQRYQIEHPSGRFMPSRATDRKQARCEAYQLRSASNHQSIVRPLGTRPEVDPAIVQILASESGLSQDHYAVIVSKDFAKSDISGEVDGARGYGYTVFVKNKVPFPDNLETLKALYRVNFLKRLGKL